MSEKAARQAQLGSRSAPAAPEQRPATAPTRAPQDDDVPALLKLNHSLVLEINRAGSELPPMAVVLARTVTDTIERVLTAPDAGMLDISVRVAVHRMLTDYLPGSIRTHVGAVRAADAAEREDADRQVLDQLTTLRRSVDELAEASRRRDLQALQVHGKFLQDKFAQSELDPQ